MIALFSALITVRAPAESFIAGISSRISDAVGWVLRTLLHMLFSPGLTPEFDVPWFREVYGRSVAVSLIVCFLALAISVIFSVLKGSTAFLLRALALDVPVAVLGMAFSLILFTTILKISDDMSDFLVSDSLKNQIGARLLRLAASSGATGTDTFMITLLTGLLLVFGGMGVMAIMFVRTAIIYVMGALIPLSFAAYMIPSLRSSVRMGAEAAVAIVFSKVAISLCLLVGVSMMGQMSGDPPLVYGDAPAATAQFSILPEGSLVYQGIYRVEEVVITDVGRGNLTYKGPVKKISGFFANFVFNVQKAAIETRLNNDPTIRVNGNKIIQINRTKCPDPPYECTIGRIGERIDPDAERLYRVIVPIDASTAEIRVLEDAADFGDNVANGRRVQLDEQFVQRVVYETEKGVATSGSKRELLAEDVSLLNPEQITRLNKAFGYKLDPVTDLAVPAPDADPDELCNSSNVNRKLIAGEGLPTYCAAISLDGVVTLGKVKVGSLGLSRSLEAYDLQLGLLGAFVLILACWSPIPLLRLFTLFDATSLLNNFADTIAKPLNKAAFISFRTSNFESFVNIARGKQSLWTGEPTDRATTPASRFTGGGSTGSSGSGRSGSGRR